jgi:hypothetical protein
MLLRRLLQFNLTVSAIIAAAFIVFPGQTLGFYGIQNVSGTRAIAQYFGSAHVTFAILIAYALRKPEPAFLRAIVRSFFGGDLVGTIILLGIQLRGVTNGMGWELVGLSVLFTVGWGICILKRLPIEE